MRRSRFQKRLFSVVQKGIKIRMLRKSSRIWISFLACILMQVAVLAGVSSAHAQMPQVTVSAKIMPMADCCVSAQKQPHTPHCHHHDHCCHVQITSSDVAPTMSMRWNQAQLFGMLSYNIVYSRNVVSVDGLPPRRPPRQQIA